MPSTVRVRTIRLWGRILSACLAVGVAAVAMVAFEAAVFGIVSYGALSVLVGAAATLVPTASGALLAALLAGVVAATSRLSVAVVSRAREYAADDAAAAVTGDPAALAAALERLDDRVAGRPSADLRGATAPFSVVPPTWEEHRFFDRTRRFVARRLLGTHPPTEQRIERLRRLADEG